MQQEAAKIKVGPYVICQKEKPFRKAKNTSIQMTPVEGVWVLPGGTDVTTSELHEIATRNGWKLG